MACRCSVRKCKDLLADVKTPYDRRYGTFLEVPIIPFGASFYVHHLKKTKADCISVVQEYSQAYSQALGVSNAEGSPRVMSDQEREEHHEADRDAKEANNDFWSITANCTHWKILSFLGTNFSCAKTAAWLPNSSQDN